MLRSELCITGFQPTYLSPFNVPNIMMEIGEHLQEDKPVDITVNGSERFLFSWKDWHRSDRDNYFRRRVYGLVTRSATDNLFRKI